MNIKIISNLIKIANTLDLNGKYDEANTLTKIAEDMTSEKSDIPQEIEDFIENTEGNFAKIFELMGASGYEYIVVSRIDEKISIGRPTISRYSAEKDFDRLKNHLWQTKIKFKSFDLPPTKEQLRKYQRDLQRGERYKGDWEPDRYRR